MGSDQSFAVAGSDHPDHREAVSALVGELFEAIDRPPSLMVMAVAGAHLHHWANVSALVRHVIQPDRVVMVAAERCWTGGQLLGRDGMAAWAAADINADVTVLPEANIPVARPEAALVKPGTVGLALAGSTMDLTRLTPSLARQPGQVAGAALGPSRGHMELDGRPVDSAGVLVTFNRNPSNRNPSNPNPSTEPGLILASAGRRVGPPLAVTKADEGRVHTLAGRPASEWMAELVFEPHPTRVWLACLSDDPDPVVTSVSEVHLSADWVRGEHDPGRPLLIGEPVEVGAVVQFLVESPEAAGPALEEAIGSGGYLGPPVATVTLADRLRYHSGSTGGLLSPEDDAQTFVELALSDHHQRAIPAGLGILASACFGPLPHERGLVTVGFRPRM